MELLTCSGPPLPWCCEEIPGTKMHSSMYDLNLTSEQEMKEYYGSLFFL